MLEQAVGATKSLDHKVLAAYLRKNEMKTIVGPISCGGRRRVGEAARAHASSAASWTRTSTSSASRASRSCCIPPQFKTGEPIAPFDKARK